MLGMYMAVPFAVNVSIKVPLSGLMMYWELAFAVHVLPPNVKTGGVVMGPAKVVVMVLKSLAIVNAVAPGARVRSRSSEEEDMSVSL